MAAAAAIATAVSVTIIRRLRIAAEARRRRPAQQSVITSTTKIAGAGVLGNQRRPDESCAPEPAALDPGPPDREVRHAAGHHRPVRADPQRIVVLSGDQLDALCALGLQSRIVAAALPDGSDQPAVVSGHRGARRARRRAPAVSPTWQAIKAAAPT